MKSEGAIEGLTIVVIPRDRYSVFPHCIQAIYDHTNIPFRLIVVSGGTDNNTKEYLERVQSQHHNMRLVLVDRLLRQGEARNLAMSQVEGQFCVVLENDTIVHQNWIVPMLKCMREERAAVVMPLVLWYGLIHAAGCVFEEGGTGGRRILNHKILYARTKRRRIDYPECHCILIDRLQIPDTEIFEDVEPFDVDLGLMPERMV
jgi:cellulose synthase/poly-beta-1,6-N-acetylglucosamine synthase-like glycosyltransferase